MDVSQLYGTALLLWCMSVCTLVLAQPTSDLTPIKQIGYCTQYGICAGTPDEQYQNCVNNTPAVTADFDASDICGPEYRAGQPLCCSEQQYHQLKDNLQRVDSVFGRCSACLHNFYAYFCAYTCSDRQAVYNTVLEYDISPTTGLHVMNHTVSTLTTTYAAQFYQSCADVQFGTTGKTVMQQLFHSASYAEFFEFLGTEDPAQSSPIQIDYVYVDEAGDDAEYALTTHDLAVTQCNTTDTRYQCSCSDCVAQCTVRPVVEHDMTDMTLLIFDSYITPYTLAAALASLMYVAVLTLAYSTDKTPAYTQRLAYVVTAVSVIACVSLIIYAPLATRSTESHPDLLHVMNSDISITSFVLYVIQFAAQLSLLVYGYVSEWSGSRRVTASTMTMPHISPSTSELYNGDDVSELGSMNGSTILTRPNRIWSLLAHLAAVYPWTLIGVAAICVAVASIGITQLVVETNPIKLWVPPSSALGAQKQQFDTQFGAFYRVQQLFVSVQPHSDQKLLSVDTLLQLRHMQQQLQSIVVTVNQTVDNTTIYRNVTFNDLCYRPIPGKGCLIESATEYFTSTDLPGPPKLDKVTDSRMLQWLGQCTSQPTYAPCRGTVGAPLFPYVVLGGFSDDEDQTNKYLNATAYAVTYLFNHVDGAEQYEAAFINTAQRLAQQPNSTLRISFMAERSVEDEIGRSQNQDVGIVALSYVAMFVYISLALGRFDPSTYSSLLIHTKFSVGAAAIGIVIASLCAAVGVVAVCGVASSPIISEVIPFLVLAIGIDNVFLLLNTYTGQPSQLTPQAKLTNTLSDVGLSITLASVSETFAFLLGGWTRMPAVQGFAFYASAAIFIDYLLQMTVFLAVLVLDDRRVKDGRVDCVPCIRAAKHSDVDMDSLSEPLMPQRNGHTDHVDVTSMLKRPSITLTYVSKYHTPFILHPLTRLFTILTAVIVTMYATAYSVQNIRLGLDQSVVLPTDSYLQQYFADLNQYLRVGPPLYFVLDTPASISTQPLLDAPTQPAIDWTNAADQNLVCSVSGCNDDSLGGTVLQQSYDTSSTIANGVTSWLDDYLSWLSSRGKCCRVNKRGKYCKPSDTSDDCTLCIANDQFVTNTTRPTPADFSKYLHMFIYESVCSIDCGLCGYAHVANVKLNDDNTTVAASRYMTYHTQLRGQKSYIDSLTHAQSIAQQITDNTGLSVYPYSVFYVYFEQYLYIESVAATIVGLALLGIFALCVTLLGNILASVIVVSVVCMVLGNLLFAMQLVGIEFNAISVVNYVMSIGIAVEFCVHIATRFMHPQNPHSTSHQRVTDAMLTVGVSVVNGITYTKLVGVSVLAYASSQVFVVYYFRMYACIVAICVLYGLVVLPTVLCMFGPCATDSNKSYWRNLIAFK